MTVPIHLAQLAYGKPLANFFPQTSWVIATHFAHNILHKNASGSYYTTLPSKDKLGDYKLSSRLTRQLAAMD